MTKDTPLYHLGNGFRRCVLGARTKTKYIFVINHNITVIITIITACAQPYSPHVTEGRLSTEMSHDSAEVTQDCRGAVPLV